MLLYWYGYAKNLFWKQRISEADAIVEIGPAIKNRSIMQNQVFQGTSNSLNNETKPTLFNKLEKGETTHEMLIEQINSINARMGDFESKLNSLSV